MCNDKIRVPVENPNEDVTHIELGVAYWKGRGIMASFCPVHVGEDFVRMNLSLMVNGSALLEPATRLNRKNVAHWLECLKRNVEARSGRGWELITACAESHKLTLAKTV